MDSVRKAASRRRADEPLHVDGTPIRASVRDFWEWSASDLLSNRQRGILAEYIVALAVRAKLTVRTEWDAFDVLAPDGTRIEVKSAAYVQSWRQSKPSRIDFDIAPKRAWDAVSNTSASTPLRSADVYVFAVLANTDPATLDPLNVNQWDFYVLARTVLDRQVPTQKRISLGALEKLQPHRCKFTSILQTIQLVRDRQA